MLDWMIQTAKGIIQGRLDRLVMDSGGWTCRQGHGQGARGLEQWLARSSGHRVCMVDSRGRRAGHSVRSGWRGWSSSSVQRRMVRSRMVVDRMRLFLLGREMGQSAVGGHRREEHDGCHWSGYGMGNKERVLRPGKGCVCVEKYRVV